jgi:hypothetical protein
MAIGYAGAKVRTPTFQLTKMLRHSRMAASAGRTAALGMSLEGGFGPFVSLDTKG